MPTLNEALSADTPPLNSVKALFERVRFSDQRLSVKQAIRMAFDAISEVDGADPASSSITVEGAVREENGTIIVDTDNPLITASIKLIKVPAEWAHGPVPQEIMRTGNGWRFANGDALLSVANGEAETTSKPVKEGSINEDAYLWPVSEGNFSGETGADVQLQTRIRVGYRPVDVKMLVRGPKGFAGNTVSSARIALDPGVLLVPIEVVRFFSDRVPVAKISMARQMALWDQIPTISAETNIKRTDGSTGELRTAERLWDNWPKKDGNGVYSDNGFVSPDAIWGRAGVRFRLVNYFEIKTDDQHVNPPRTGGDDDATVRENFSTARRDPRHMQGVITVIFMHRIHHVESQVVGTTDARLRICGISVEGGGDLVLAHEIGHALGLEHAPGDSNIMRKDGPGPDTTDYQLQRVREAAQHFAGFWQH